MADQPADSIPRWLDWAREIQALAQTGLHYAPDDYHRDRYKRLLAIAAEIVAGHSNLPQERLAEVFLSQRGYSTPKVDVRGAVFRGGKILLVRERVDGGWCMPGGWADVGELPSAMVEREVREESGLRVRAARLIGLYDANRSGTPLEVFHAYKAVFLCEDLGGTPGPSNETSEAGFFSPEGIPPLSPERTTTRQLRDAFSFQLDSQRPVAFD